jgi:Fe-S cluster assembly protein SufD
MPATIPASSLKNLSASVITAFSNERREPAWVLELRLAAFENFSALPWPHAKSENWKRLPIEDLKFDDFTLGKPSGNLIESVESLSGRIRQLGQDEKNGSTPARRWIELARGQAVTIPEAFRERNVEWLSLEEAIQTKADRVKSAWKNAVDRAKTDKFRSLVLALANGGSCLTVPSGTLLKTPVQTYVAAGGETNSAQFPLNFYFLEEGSETQIWEELVARDGAAATQPLFVCNLTVIEMKENARASVYSLQNWDDQVTHFQFQDVDQKSFSHYNAVAISLGGRIFRNETTINLNGAGAENKVLGVLFGERSQNFENWITQNHVAPKTISDIQFRGALKGSSRSFFSGLVSIKKEAQQSDAFQSAKTMLLSPDAKADAIPNLEILADDVKCSHGAAVGPVDPDQKFYLQSRGIDPDTAEKAIIEGFFEPVIAEVPSETVQERLRQFVEYKIKRP